MMLTVNEKNRTTTADNEVWDSFHSTPYEDEEENTSKNHQIS